jgi:formylglycine-generating enzyme required for sulfatase activity
VTDLLDSVVRDLGSALEPHAVASASAREWASLLSVLDAAVRAAFAHDGDGDAASELLAMAAVHPSPYVRRTLVGRVAALGSLTDGQRELLCWAISDSDDAVALTAIGACERHRITEALLPLADSLGRAPDRLDGSLAGLTDLRTYAAIRAARALRQDSWAPEDVAREARASAHEASARADRSADLEGTLLVPAGTARLGLKAGARAPGWFPADNYISTPRLTEVSAFYMDARCVTNQQYDAFVAASRDDDHTHCHPDEPPGTDHIRATILDPWAQPEHPVTGVSWFDAHSYASYYGKRLPSDVEWEYAAGGSDGLLYPWGDEFHTDACRWLATTLGRRIDSFEAWQGALELLVDDEASPRTAAPDEYPDNVSPFRISDLTGNVWEWTRSRYLDGADVQPRGWSPTDPRLRGDWTAVACVKGGSWASGGDMLLNAYRGRMALHRRSPEVGFRCVAAVGG